MEIRLQKYMAKCGVASRRKSEEIILSGQVTVNGLVVTEMGYKIDDEKDIVFYNGNKIVIEEKKIYIALNKPVGYITTVSDQFNRKTVLDLISSEINERIYPVGRLDYDTSGLILLTNDGNLTYKLTHPKHGVLKTYIAEIKEIPTEEKLTEFRNGLKIEDYTTSKAEIEILKVEKETCIVKIIISEGRNRQVRKMCSAIGHEVLNLKRIAVGEITLGNLKVGEFRFLTENELSYLQ